MRIFNYFQHITLTSDQRKALEQINAFLQSDDDVFILKGYAGTGKTTLLKGLVKYLKSIRKKIQLMAPTGRAAKIINQKTGFEATTIHKGIYSFEKLHEIEKSDDENNVSFLYQYNIRNNPEAYRSVLLVDEASMVSDVLSQGEFFRFGSGHLLQDLFTYSRIQLSSTTSKIIFIGDPVQLPPIGMNFSPALDANYLKQKYQLKVCATEMKEVKRLDSNNGILKAATKIRQCLTSGFFNDFDLKENKKDIFNPKYADFLKTYKAQTGHKIIITFKNKTALGLNQTIRKDKFGSDLPIQPTDTVIIGGNNYLLGIMNGEFAVVSNVSASTKSREVKFYTKGGEKQTVKLIWRSVELLLSNENRQPKTVAGLMLENYLYGDNTLKPEEQQALYVDFKIRHPELKPKTEEFKEKIANDKYFNCILLKYGYAVTCHKAQGGEWKNTFVFWDKGVQANFNFLESEHNRSGKTNADFYRWSYTAITRASNKLFCINPPYFNSFSGMSFIDINVQHAFEELTGQSTQTIELDFDGEVFEILKKYNLHDAPLTIQNHFIKNWYHLKKQNIEIINWERVGYEIRYTYKKVHKTASFKYWINGQNEFKSNFQKIPAATNSDELFETITKLLENAPSIHLNRNNADSIISKFEFDLEVEEQKPFLKTLFDAIKSESASINLTISNITHLEHKERYTFERGSEKCTVDFEYDSKGFFGRVLPIKNRCNSHKLTADIRAIVMKLKNPNYVV